MLAELFALDEPAAADGYASVAKVFDDTAAKFAGCAAKVDVEADSEAMVSQSGPVRSAWLDTVGHSRRLDELVVLLVAAATLAGVVIDADELLLPLVIRNAADLHRRKLWTAFNSANPRCAATELGVQEAAREPVDAVALLRRMSSWECCYGSHPPRAAPKE